MKQPSKKSKDKNYLKKWSGPRMPCIDYGRMMLLAPQLF